MSAADDASTTTTTSRLCPAAIVRVPTESESVFSIQEDEPPCQFGSDSVPPINPTQLAPTQSRRYTLITPPFVKSKSLVALQSFSVAVPSIVTAAGHAGVRQCWCFAGSASLAPLPPL